MTVRDLSTLARRIISEFPEYFGYYGEREYEYAASSSRTAIRCCRLACPGSTG